MTNIVEGASPDQAVTFMTGGATSPEDGWWELKPLDPTVYVRVIRLRDEKRWHVEFELNYRLGMKVSEARHQADVLVVATHQAHSLNQGRSPEETVRYGERALDVPAEYWADDNDEAESGVSS